MQKVCCKKNKPTPGCQSSPKNSVASTFAKGGFGLLLELFTLSTQLLIASELKRTRLDAPAPGEQRPLLVYAVAQKSR